jgi:hypothetical protein
VASNSNDIEAVRQEAHGPSACCGAPTTLLRRDAGAGGVQVRAYCRECWSAGRALPHNLVAEFECIEELPEANVELLERAAVQVARQRWMR